MLKMESQLITLKVKIVDSGSVRTMQVCSHECTAKLLGHVKIKI